MMDLILETLDTGTGYWHPLVWITSFVIIFLLVFIFRGFGNKKYKKGTGQTQAFLSGNVEYDKQFMHVQSSNLYWGWTESLKWVLDALKKMHTGNVSDYVLWFVVVMGLLLLSVGLI